MFTCDHDILKAVCNRFLVPATLKEVQEQVIADAEEVPDLASMKFEEVTEEEAARAMGGKEDEVDPVIEDRGIDLEKALDLLRGQCDLFRNATYYCTSPEAALGSYETLAKVYHNFLQEIPNVRGAPVLRSKDLRFKTLAGTVPRRYKGRVIKPLRPKKRPQKAAKLVSLEEVLPKEKGKNDVILDDSMEVVCDPKEEECRDRLKGKTTTQKIKILLCSRGSDHIRSCYSAGKVANRICFGQGYIVDSRNGGSAEQSCSSSGVKGGKSLMW